LQYKIQRAHDQYRDHVADHDIHLYGSSSENVLLVYSILH